VSVCEAELKIFRSSAEVLELVRGFECGTLPRAEWTHRAHLTVALWYCLRYSETESVRLMREGIKRYNDAHGIINTRESGYHETLTLFWLRLVRCYLKEVSTFDCTLAVLANELCKRCGDKSLPLTYYARERLMSAEARMNWIEPDLRELN